MTKKDLDSGLCSKFEILDSMMGFEDMKQMPLVLPLPAKICDLGRDSIQEDWKQQKGCLGKDLMG